MLRILSHESPRVFATRISRLSFEIFASETECMSENNLKNETQLGLQSDSDPSHIRSGAAVESNHLPLDPAPAGVKSKQTWHRLYYGLAGFDLITIMLSLILTHHLISIHSSSIGANEKWIKRATQYDEIATVAAQVNAPGNDVFDSLDVKAERSRLNEALGAFNAKMNVAMLDLNSIESPTSKQELTAHLKKINARLGEMVAEAELIFAFFSNNDAKSAGSRMATMDRKFNLLNRAFDDLRSNVRQIQMNELKRESERANQLSRWEYGFAFMILVMVILVTWYGHLIARKISEADEIIVSQREKMIASAKLASLGTMAAGIAHEINNPIAIINGSATGIKRQIAKGKFSSEQVIEASDRILKTCDRVLGIVRGLRTFARNGEQDPFEIVYLKDLIHESAGYCSERFHRNKVELQIDFASFEGVSISCQRTQFSQVIINLLNNAFDAVASQDKPWVRVSGSASSNHVKIAITDSGNGIPEVVLRQMFTPFFSTKEVGKGTGLGLSISMGIIKSHQGAIEYNRESQNTCFVITLAHANAKIKSEIRTEAA